MIVSPKHRFLVQYEIAFRTARDQGPAPDLYDEEQQVFDVYDILVGAIRHKKNTITVGTGEEIELLIVDHRAKQGVVDLLFKRSDPNASHQMYSHVKTKALRKSDKKHDEAVAVSSHLIIHKKNIGNYDLPKYNSLLEEMPGISKSHVISLLGAILKTHPYAYRDKRGESKDTHAMVNLRGVPSQALGGAVQGGRVPGITLIRSANTDGLDHGGVLVPKEERMRLALKATKDPINWINKVTSWGRERGYDSFRVDIDTPDNRSRSVSLSRDEDAASVLFVKSIPVSLSTPIEVCSHTIVEELVQHATTIL